MKLPPRVRPLRFVQLQGCRIAFFACCPTCVQLWYFVEEGPVTTCPACFTEMRVG